MEVLVESILTPLFVNNRILARSPAGRGGSVFLPIGMIESCIAAKTALIACLCGRHTLLHQLARMKQALFRDVSEDSITGMLPEQVHKIGSVQRGFSGDQVHRQAFLKEVAADTVDGLPDDRVRSGFPDCGRIFKAEDPACKDQKLHEPETAKQGGAVSRIVRTCPQLSGQHREPLCTGIARADQVRMGLFAAGKAIEKIGIFLGVSGEKIRRNVDDNSLIDRIIQDDRPVNLTGTDRNQIQRFEIILAAFHHVRDISGQKENQLVKIVIMEGDVPFMAVDIVEYMKILMQVAGFPDRVLNRLHLTYLPLISSGSGPPAA